MPFAAALSTARSTREAGEAVCREVRGTLPGPADFGILFFSPHHAAEAEALTEAVTQGLGAANLIGCVGESVVGNDREVEGQPALSLWAARWKRKVAAQPFHLVVEKTSEGPAMLGWPDGLEDAAGEGDKPGRAAMIVLGDPFTFPTDAFLKRMNADHAGVPVVGGMASGFRMPGEARLILGGQVLDRGAVGVLLRGDLGLRCIVSQGCRPIGQPMIVTRARDNVIEGLGGKSPLEQLQELWVGLPARDQQLVREGLHVGRVINEYRGDFQRGDFLVRNVVGLDQSSGALVITDRLRVGQTVQFHVRDAATADEDLHELLQIDLAAHARKPAAALLFSCNGRGTRLFEGPNHDAGVLRGEAGAIPVAGFFAQGELGPVGGQNFIHGFTASVALFEE